MSLSNDFDYAVSQAFPSDAREWILGRLNHIGLACHLAPGIDHNNSESISYAKGNIFCFLAPFSRFGEQDPAVGLLNSSVPTKSSRGMCPLTTSSDWLLFLFI